MFCGRRRHSVCGLRMRWYCAIDVVLFTRSASSVGRGVLSSNGPAREKGTVSGKDVLRWTKRVVNAPSRCSSNQTKDAFLGVAEREGERRPQVFECRSI